VGRWRCARLACLGLLALASLAGPAVVPSSASGGSRGAAVWAALAAEPLGRPGGEELRGAAEVAGTDGEGLRVRRAADPEAETRAILPDGTPVEVLEGPVQAAGRAWYRVGYSAAEPPGWVAGQYLVAVAAPPARTESGTASSPPRAAGGSDAAGLPPAQAARPRLDAIFAPALGGEARTGPASGVPAALMVPTAPDARAVGAPGPAALFPVRPLPPVESTDRRFGLVEAFRLSDRGLGRAAGARFERLTFWWRGLQAAPGAPLNPSYFPMEVLDAERTLGFELAGLLINTPDWAARSPSDGPRSVPKNLSLPWDHPDNYWGRFVQQVARTYAGRVDDWIIWNEPDITPGDPNAAYYAWAGSVEEYAQLLRVAYRAVKAGNPAARVHLAGLTYWVDRRGGRPQYFERLLDALAGDPAAAANNYYFDVATLHLYTDPRALYYVPGLYRELMRARGMDKPIWVNETNVIPWDDPTNRGTGYDIASGMRCTLADQASYLLQAFGLGLAGGAERIAVYRSEDGYGAAYNGAVDAIERSALVREDGSLRPAYVAYQTAVSYLRDARGAQYFPGATIESVAVDRPGGQRTTVLWNGAPYPMVARLGAAGARAELVNAAGQVQPLSAGTDGTYAIALAPATCNTDPDDPARYLMGGETYLVVEYEVPAGRPARAAQAEPAPPPPLRGL
jgi:hypothetical protein